MKNLKKIQIVLAAACLVMFTMQSCSKKEEGCNDSSACNFNADAEENDGSCTYATKWYADADGDGLGDASSSVEACDKPSGYVSNSNAPTGPVVAKKQRAVVTYVGATWCPPCGAYGDPTKIYMEDTYGEDVVILSVQSGDDISQSGAFGPKFGNVFQSARNVSSIPHIYYSGSDFTMVDQGFYGSAATNNSNADASVTAIMALDPEVGVAAEASIEGNVVTVNTASKFYAAGGEHFIGVYLMEDNVQNSQAGSSSTDHDNVMRAGASTGSGSLGTVSLGTSFTANQEVRGTYTINVPNTVVDNANLKVAVVVWSSDDAEGVSNAILVHMD